MVCGKVGKWLRKRLCCVYDSDSHSGHETDPDLVEYFDYAMESSYAKVTKWLENNAEYFNTAEPHYSIEDELWSLDVFVQEECLSASSSGGSFWDRSVSYESIVFGREFSEAALLGGKTCMDRKAWVDERPWIGGKSSLGERVVLDDEGIFYDCRSTLSPDSFYTCVEG